MLTNLRRFVVVRGTLRGREVEFQWEDRAGLGDAPTRDEPTVVDVLTREPAPPLNSAEWLILQKALDR